MRRVSRLLAAATPFAASARLMTASVVAPPTASAAPAAASVAAAAASPETARQLEELIAKAHNQFSRDAIQAAIKEFYALGLEATYFKGFSTQKMFEHVAGFMVAQLNARTGEKVFSYNSESEKSAFYWCGEKDQLAMQKDLEAYIEKKKDLLTTHGMSIRSYSSASPMPITGSRAVILCVDFTPFKTDVKSGKFSDMVSKNFEEKPAAVQERYKRLVEKLSDSILPVYETANHEHNRFCSISLALQPDRTLYLAELTTLLSTIPGALVVKQFVESFANGAQVYTIYCAGAKEEQLASAALVLNMLPNLPNHPITHLYHQRKLNGTEVMYAHALTLFAFYFMPQKKSEEFAVLEQTLGGDELSKMRLKKVRNELWAEMMSETYIAEQIAANLATFKKLYADFVAGPTAESNAKLAAEIASEYKDQSTVLSIFQTMLTFNTSVLKTNFFKVNKAAVSFRLDTSKFFDKLDFPRVPYGVFMFVGSRFRGFHVRFTDIARGGIRVVISKNEAAYRKNGQSLINENFGLAYTQLLKNKDIAEGGSKGTILMNFTPDKIEQKVILRTFMQYVDSMLDLLLDPKDGVRNAMPNKEILFLGPDENTAGDFPTIAAEYARNRGYPQWKSFTTGKSPSLGGIPHDIYGMTTCSVREFVYGIRDKLKLPSGEQLTKVITGGPDGDLGSNEILMGDEKLIAIVDGKGVVYDPNGISKTELVRLVKAGHADKDLATLNNFNTKVLGKGGFYVGVDQKNVTLPDGTVVEDGTAFRDNFHFYEPLQTDFFVPCGGRPEAVKIENVHKFLVDMPGVKGTDMFAGKVGNLAGTKKLKYKYIVEGANLFISNDARIALENVGVLVFKDASTNKGGVTSSSLEVLAGLALTDAEHKEHMCVSNGKLPDFYNKYVEQIVARVKHNARREFECIWAECQRNPELKKTLVTNDLSGKIVSLRAFISKSDLFDNATLARNVISKYVPQVLLEKVGVEGIFTRVPRNYLEAMFAAGLASDFVYTYGLKADDFAFFQYLHSMQAPTGAATGASATDATAVAAKVKKVKAEKK